KGRGGLTNIIFSEDIKCSLIYLCICFFLKSLVYPILRIISLQLPTVVECHMHNCLPEITAADYYPWRSPMPNTFYVIIPKMKTMGVTIPVMLNLRIFLIPIFTLLFL